MTKHTIGQFGYQLFTRAKEAPRPMHPFVRLCLAQWGDTVGGASGAPAISPQLMTEQEIDVLIQQLKEDLDKVAAHAKRDLRKAVSAHLEDPSKN